MFVTDVSAQTPTPETDQALPPSEDAAAAHGETIHIEGEHAPGGFPPMDTEFFPSQLLWLAITFGLFYWLLSKAILPRIAGILESRRDRIALDLEAAERMKADADEAHAAYEQELAQARERAQAIAGEAHEAARQDAERERRQIEADLNSRLEAAQTRIAAIKNEALSKVGQIAEEATEAILSEVAGLSVPREEISSAIRQARS